MKFSASYLRTLEALRIRRAVLQTPGGIGGVRTSRRFGGGAEFAEHRAYTPGDDPRDLDWKLYARLGLFQIKTLSAEENQSTVILLDISRSMGTPNLRKFDLALQLAAGIASLSLRLLDRLTVVSADQTVRRILVPQRGRGSLGEIIRYLESEKPEGNGTDLKFVFKKLVQMGIRPGTLWLLSDLYDERGFRFGLGFLPEHHFRLMPIRMTDHTSPRFPHGPLELIDSETGETKIVNGSRETISQKEKEYTERLRHAALAAGTPLYEADIERSPLDFLKLLTGETV